MTDKTVFKISEYLGGQWCHEWYEVSGILHRSSLGQFIQTVGPYVMLPDGTLLRHTGYSRPSHYIDYEFEAEDFKKVSYGDRISAKEIVTKYKAVRARICEEPVLDSGDGYCW